MTHSFMAAVADGLFQRGLATLRYQFPFTQEGLRRPDRPAVAHATVRAAVNAAMNLLPAVPLIAGGKSFGGRMTSQAQAEHPLPNVRGLVFLGFPLHPPKEPSEDRAKHLSDVAVPMFFLQGMRDQLAETDLMNSVVARLGPRATLELIDQADHSFQVPARGHRTNAQVLAAMLDAMTGWVHSLLGLDPH